MTDTIDETVAAGARPAASNRADVVTLLLSTWFAGGLFLDAWAHNNVPDLESFFTPWHAVFYSGFTVTAAWLLWVCRAALTDRRRAILSIPVGYASSLVALVVFALAGAGDLAWHQLFGIEQSIDILFSPTHLLLGASMLVIVTTPLRAALADESPPARSGLRLLPALGSLSLATTIVLLFLQYANALSFTSGEVALALTGQQQGRTAQLVSAIAITSALLVVALVVLVRRWTPPPGSATLLYTVVACLGGAVTGFANLELLAAMVVAGVCADLLYRWLRPSPERLVALWSFGALVPLVTWTAYVAAAYLGAPDIVNLGGVHPTAMVELYTGVPVVQALIGLLLVMLLVPSRRPGAPAPDPT